MRENMLGSRVRAHFLKKEPGRGGKWLHIEREGVIVRDFMLTVGNQSLFQVRHDDGTFNNCWNDQLEVLEE